MKRKGEVRELMYSGHGFYDSNLEWVGLEGIQIVVFHAHAVHQVHCSRPHVL